MKPLFLSLTLFFATSIFSQPNQPEQYHSWKKLVLLSKFYGINSEAVKVHAYSNNNRKIPAREWIFPWAIGLEQSEIKKKVFSETNYKSYSSMYFSIGRNGFKHFRNNIFFNGMLSIGLGNEKLTSFSNEKTNQFLFGLEASQGLLFIPKSQFGLVLGLGVFEKVFTSKIYSFDAGIQITAGIAF